MLSVRVNIVINLFPTCTHVPILTNYNIIDIYVHKSFVFQFEFDSIESLHHQAAFSSNEGQTIVKEKCSFFATLSLVSFFLGLTRSLIFQEILLSSHGCKL